MTEILVDADGCPVKEESLRVARRYGITVQLVANARLRFAPDPLLRQVVVGEGFDAADDWIVAHSGPASVVVTGDVVLAGRCLAAGARVLSPRGRVFTEDSIGDALAGRELAAHLRELGERGGGAPPFARRDRSLFLQKLDELVQAARRAGSP